MINKIDIPGFFVDDDTAKEIADFLEDYKNILESKLESEKNIYRKNEIVVQIIDIKEICQTFRGEQGIE